MTQPVDSIEQNQIAFNGRVMAFDPTPTPCNPEQPMAQCSHCRRRSHLEPRGHQVVLDASIMSTASTGECLLRLTRN